MHGFANRGRRKKVEEGKENRSDQPAASTRSAYWGFWNILIVLGLDIEEYESIDMFDVERYGFFN